MSGRKPTARGKSWLLSIQMRQREGLTYGLREAAVPSLPRAQTHIHPMKTHHSLKRMVAPKLPPEDGFALSKCLKVPKFQQFRSNDGTASVHVHKSFHCLNYKYGKILPGPSWTCYIADFQHKPLHPYIHPLDSSSFSATSQKSHSNLEWCS